MQESSQIPTHCSYDPLSPMREAAPPILSLKFAKPREYLDRFAFLILDLIAKERYPTEDELHEVFYIKDRLEGLTDVAWIHTFYKVYNECCTLWGIITAPHPELKNSTFLRCSFHMKEFQFKLQLGCAYFGKRKANPPKSLLKKRSPYSRKGKTYRKKFIGVGYNDHGTMKNPAVNGNPHWKEVSRKLISGHGRLTEGERCMLAPLYGRFRRHPVNRMEEFNENEKGNYKSPWG